MTRQFGFTPDEVVVADQSAAGKISIHRFTGGATPTDEVHVIFSPKMEGMKELREKESKKMSTLDWTGLQERIHL
jgi:hypothetical protein